MFKTSQLTERQKKLFQTAQFLFKLLMLGIPFQILLHFRPDTVAIQSMYAAFTSEILGVIGLETAHSGINVVIGTHRYIITQDCLGWKSMTVFSALIIASDSDLRKHLKFIVLGLAAIFFANLIRIISTIVLSEFEVISYSVIHGTLWKWGLTATVLILWIYWLHRENENTSKSYRFHIESLIKRPRKLF